jgi:hypothetical protein
VTRFTLTLSERIVRVLRALDAHGRIDPSMQGEVRGLLKSLEGPDKRAPMLFLVEGQQDDNPHETTIEIFSKLS